MSYSKVINKAYGESAIDEIQVAAAVTPTYLLELTSANKVQHHSTAGGPAVPIIVAKEQTGIGLAIGTASGASDFVPVVYPRSGDLIIMSLKASENVAIGDKLESAGDGTLRKAVADTSAGTIALNSVVGVAKAASNVASIVQLPVLIR